MRPDFSWMHGWAVKFAAGILACAIGLELLAPVKLMMPLDRFFFDLGVWFHADRTGGLTESSVVAFDNDALKALGYPIDRSMYAQVLSRVQTLKPKQISFDVIFGESKDVLGTDKLALSMGASTLITLAAIRQDSGKIDGPAAPVSAPQRALGLTDFVVDEDGRLRWYPLMLATSDGYLPSLGFAMYLKASDQTAEVIVGPRGGISAIDVKNEGKTKRRIQLSDDPLELGRIPLVPRALSADVPSISWLDILGDDSSPSAIKGRSVVIGAIADGVSAHQATALDPIQAPIHNHLFAFEDLQQERWLKGVPIWARVLLLFLTAAAMSRIFLAAPKSLFEVNAMAVLMPAVIISLMLCLWSFGWLWHPSDAIGFSLAIACLGVVRKLDVEEQRKRKLLRSFGSYLHPALIQRMLTDGVDIVLEGQTREITILFSDLRNFTSLSEKLSPGDLVTVLNQYFQVVARHVQEQEGTVDKFIGDAVMAFWNAPIDCANHRAFAAKAVQSIMQDFDALSASWTKTYRLEEPVTIGIGIHSGEAVVGNVGGANRFNYTALGNSVNLASRLEGVCKPYSVSLVVSSDFLAEMSGEDAWLELDTIQVKGQTTAVRIFTLVSASFSSRDKWQKFLALWRSGDFATARKILVEIPDLFGPKAEFARRLASLPETDFSWDGIWKLSSK